MISHGGAGSRDVVFTLRTEPDDKSRSVLRDYGKSLADADLSLQKQVRRERAATAKAHESLLRDEERAAKQSNMAIEREHGRLVDRKRQSYVSLARQAREHTLTEQREAKASADARIAEEERVARAVRKAQGERLLAQKRAGMADRAALGSGFSSAMSGASEVARGAAYLGLVGEADSQKVLNTVLQVEGAVGLGRGLWELGRTVTSTAGAIARLGAAAPVAVAGLAAFASLKVGHELYRGEHGPGTLSWYSGYGLELADRLGQHLHPGSQAVTTRDFLHMEESQAMTQRMTEAAIARRMQREQLMGLDGRIRGARLSAFEADRAGIRQSVLLGDRTEWQASVADFIATAGHRNSAQRDRLALGSTRDERWMGAAKAELAAQDELLGARERMYRLGLADKENRIAAVNESILRSKEELQVQERITDTIRGRLLSAKERFGMLSEEDQQRAIYANQQLEAGNGKALSREDISLVKSVGLQRTDELAIAAANARADQAGFNRFFGAEERQQIEQAAKERMRLTQEMAVQQQTKVTLEFDREAFKAMFRDQYRANLAEMKELMQEVQRQETDALWTEVNNLKGSIQNQKGPSNMVKTDPNIQKDARMRW